MKEYYIQVRVKNNLMLQKMREHGIPSGMALTRLSGASQGAVNQYLNFQQTPYDKNGHHRETILQVCEVLNCLPEDIFPEQHLHHKMRKNASSAEMSLGDLNQILGPPKDEMKILEHVGLKDAIDEAIDSLQYNGEAQYGRSYGDRNKDMLRMRFGLDGDPPQTLDVIAKKHKVGKERVRQIVARSVRQLRHPSRTEKLRTYLDDAA